MLNPDVNVRSYMQVSVKEKNIDTIGTKKSRSEGNFQLEVTIMTISFFYVTKGQWNEW